VRVSKDILRASQLALLDQTNKRVAADLLKVSSVRPAPVADPAPARRR
jgi:hypothetical protein